MTQERLDTRLVAQNQPLRIDCCALCEVQSYLLGAQYSSRDTFGQLLPYTSIRAAFFSTAPNFLAKCPQVAHFRRLPVAHRISRYNPELRCNHFKYDR